MRILKFLHRCLSKEIQSIKAGWYENTEKMVFLNKLRYPEAATRDAL